MSNAKYIGPDVHQATTVAAVLDTSGKLVMEAIVETKAATVLDFIEGIRGELNVTLEEGTCAAWLHDLVEPHAHRQPAKSTNLAGLNTGCFTTGCFGCFTELVIPSCRVSPGTFLRR